MSEIRWAISLLGAISDVPEPAPRIEVFGHEETVARLRAMLNAGGEIPHTLLMGPPGVGKTYLARWVAGEMQRPFYEWMCPVSEPIPEFGVVLLDECHRERSPEHLFPFMDGRNSVTVTFIGATTRPEKLDAAFRSRFGLQLRLYPMSEEALVQIAIHHGLPEDHAVVFAKASWGIPRNLKAFIDTAHALGTSDPEQVFPACQVTADGIDRDDIELLRAMSRANRPVGLTQLAALSGMDEDEIRGRDRKLVEAGLIVLRPNGRQITRKGVRYLEEVIGGAS